MLDILRANTRSVLTYVLFGIIIVVFIVSFGPGSRGCTSGGSASSSYAAQVNGKPITAAEVDQVHNQLLRMYQARFGQAFTPEMATQMGLQLRSQALDQAVDRELVIAEAAKRGIVVTDDEVSRTITAIKAFQRDGQFRKETYEQWATQNHGSPARFEERLRRDLAFQNAIAVLRDSANVSDDEVKEAWLDESDRVNVTFVRFPLAAAKLEVKLSEPEVQSFLTANGTRVEQYYKDHTARYEKKKEVHARHILLKVPEKAAPAVAETARKKIEELAERLKKGEDFAKLARENSDDTGSKQNGGDLGFFGEGAMVKPFEDAAFALAPGQVSAPIRTDFGWHLIRVEAVQKAETTPLDKAKVEIARELLTEERAKTAMQQRAQETLSKAQAGQRLADLFPTPAAKDAKEKKDAVKKPEPIKIGGLPVSAEETGSFSRSGDSVPRLGPVPALVADAFQADAGKVLSKIYDTPAGPVVAVVKEHQRPDPAKFAERKGDLTTRLRSRRETEIEAAWIKSLREKAKITTNQAFLRGEMQRPNVDLD